MSASTMRLARVIVIAFAVVASASTVRAQVLPVYLRDRGTGVKASQFGTYVRQGELLVYPFFEWYYDSNLEYKPSDFGFIGGQDFRGRYHASEGLLWFGYGLGPDLAVEFEAAVITARLQKSPQDVSAMPSELKQSGLGDVEAQVRWRFRRETQRRPELFTFFETVFPFQKRKKLIGTPNYELKLGFGATRGGPKGTWTLRAAAEYNAEERKFEPGEYAIEYLKRISPAWRVVALIEGNQIDEVELITEIQWRFLPRATLKLNNGLGLTTNATDVAPEVGVMFAF